MNYHEIFMPFVAGVALTAGLALAVVFMAWIINRRNRD